MITFERECRKINENGPRSISPFFIPMMIANIAAGTISIRFNAQGPSLPVVTACATSTNTIGEAFRAIRHGYADAIIAGGSEAALTPLGVAGFSNMMALSTRNDPKNSSIPFDKRRDGFVMGEGAGILVLEEYEHAKARGAKIYAEITGYGNTLDAHHITAPHPEATGGAAAIRNAIAETGLDTEKSTSTRMEPPPRSTTKPKPSPSKRRWGKRPGGCSSAPPSR
jgi:3-oxoacyl-[acyl-carrier-protein] synthase II